MDDDFVKIAYADLAACIVGSLLWFSDSDGAHAVGQAILVFAGVIAVPALFIVLVDLGARLSMLWSREARGPTAEDAGTDEADSSGPSSR